MNQSNSNYSFLKSFRLLRRREFLQNGSKGRKLRGSLLTISAVELDRSDKPSRVGITVSKKVNKRAVIRNRIKRQLREIFRLHRSRFTKRIEIVISARAQAVDSTYSELENEFLNLLHSYLN